MGFKRFPVRCSICKDETALVGEDIDRKYTTEFFESRGWVFSKYKTMCPKCHKKEQAKFEQIGIECLQARPDGAVPDACIEKRELLFPRRKDNVQLPAGSIPAPRNLYEGDKVTDDRARKGDQADQGTDRSM